MRVLIVVATAAEAERLQDLPARVVVSGVGPVAAALAAWRSLSSHAVGAPYDLLVSAGIGGAYPSSGLSAGDLAVSSQIIQADLGAQDGPDFLDLGQLGLSVFPNRQSNSPQSSAVFPAWAGAEALAVRSGAAYGPMLTLNTVTGTKARAEELERRYVGALTEGMEGAGVAHAALLAGLPALELRGVSNPVGPRDRTAWQIPAALAATRRGLEALLNIS